MSNGQTSSAAEGRRRLRFETLDDALAEAERLAAAEQAGRLTTVGKWTLGQALGHMATWANFAFDGYPASVRAPWLVRMIVRGFKNRILKKGMMAGVKIRGVPGGTLGLDAHSTDEGLKRFEAAFNRLNNSTPAIPNPMFGVMSRDEWIALNLRHAELHLGHFLPKD